MTISTFRSNPGLLALVLLTLLVACAPESTKESQVEKGTLAELTVRLKQVDDVGYEGGLSQRDLALTKALANTGIAAGIARRECEPYDPMGGQLISRQENPDNATVDTSNLVLNLLDDTIQGGNRKQRDIAFMVIARMGPGTPITPDYLQRYGDNTPWARVALSAVTCENWSPGDVWDMWSPMQLASLEAVPRSEISQHSVNIMINQMLNKHLTFPPDIFSHALYNRGYSDALTVDAVSQLLPTLKDKEYPISTRIEAIKFVQALGSDPDVFEEALLDLYEHEHGELAVLAGFALIQVGSRHGANVLSDVIESEQYFHWAWAPGKNCEYPPRNERLVETLKRQLDSHVLAIRKSATEALGCLQEPSAIPALEKVLKMPYWSQQVAAAEALENMPNLPDETANELLDISDMHWSGIVRKAAKNAVAKHDTEIAQDISETEHEGIDQVSFLCFSRCAIDHELPVCHGAEPGDGIYGLPWIDSFEVEWKEAKSHDLPARFPIDIREMREREGYGTNTFYRVSDGWLFSVDLWHYDGDFGFVSDEGEVQRFGPDTLNAAFIIDTQFGITALAQDIFGGGQGGVLATLTRDNKGRWHYEALLELPSEAFGYAFAPDGTLLVKDPYGAVAITLDREIFPMQCVDK